MNLARFQLALNHDDPDIVVRGLYEFQERIIKEHDAVASFGYNGRSLESNQSGPNHPVATTGLLKEYIASSPQLEELFVLFQLPGRHDNTTLVQTHTSCLSAILFCAQSDAKCCDTIVARVLSEQSKCILNQLSMSSSAVVHSTLGLLLNMCRASDQNCRDTYSRLINHATEFNSLLQRGKGVSYEAVGKKVYTDARYLIILIVFCLLKSSDVPMQSELLAHRSLYSRVINGIHKDPDYTKLVICLCVLDLLSSPSIRVTLKADLVDTNFLTKLLEFQETDEESGISNELISSVLSAYSSALSQAVGGTRKGGSGGGDVHGRITMFIKQLKPHVYLFHRELLAPILNSRPALLSRCFAAIPTQWEHPKLTLSYITSLSYVCHLLDTVDIDPALRSAARNLTSSASDRLDLRHTDKMEGPVKTFVTSLCRSLLPSGMTKRDLSRILQHKSPLVQRMGLILFLRVIQRIEKCLREISHHTAVFNSIQGHLLSSIAGILPDIQLVFSLRNRYIKVFFENQASSICQGGGKLSTSVNDENGVSTLDSDEHLQDRGAYFSKLILIILEKTFKTIPMLIPTQCNYDITRLLDDIVTWDSDKSSSEYYTSIQEKLSPVHNPSTAQHTADIVVGTLRVLHAATLGHHCKWFGPQSDSVKTLSSVIVSQKWDITVKRTALTKLLLLSCLPNAYSAADIDEHSKYCTVEPVDVSRITEAANLLLSHVLTQSELFQGHGVTDVEMVAERSAWLSVIKRCIASTTSPTSQLHFNFIFIYEMLLKISFHWNIELCSKAYRLLLDSSDGTQEVYSLYAHKKCVPFSPVLFSAILLCCGDFGIFSTQLPNHINSHLTALHAADNKEAISFFDKYCVHFRQEAEFMVSQVLLTLLPCTPVSSSLLYSVHRCTLATAKCTTLAPQSVTDMTLSACSLVCYSSTATKAKVPSKEVNTLRATMEFIDLENLSSFQSSLQNTLHMSDAVVRDVCSAYATPSVIASVVLNILNWLPMLNADSISSLSTSEQQTCHFIRQWWMLVVEVALTHCKDNVSEMFIEWVMNVVLGACDMSRKSFDHKVFMVSYCLQLLKTLSDFLSSMPVSQNKTRKRTRSSSLTDSSKQIKLKELCDQLSVVIIDVIKSTACAPIIASVLNTSHILDHFLEANYIGMLYRRILCAAVLCQYRRIQTQSKKRKQQADAKQCEDGGKSLWIAISNKVRDVSLSSTGNDGSELFSLCWTLQMIVDAPALRSMFMNYAIECGDAENGFMLTSFNQKQLLKTNDRQMHSILFSGMTAVQRSIVQSAGPRAIVRAIAGLGNKVMSVSVDDRGDYMQNALLGTVVETNGRYSNVEKGELKCPSFYCEPLSLYDPTENISSLGSLSRNMSALMFFSSLSPSVKCTTGSVLRSIISSESNMDTQPTYGVQLGSVMCSHTLSRDSLSISVTQNWSDVCSIPTLNDSVVQLKWDEYKATLLSQSRKLSGVVSAFDRLLLCNFDIFKNILLNVLSTVQRFIDNNQVEIFVHYITPAFLQSVNSIDSLNNNEVIALWASLFIDTFTFIADKSISILKKVSSEDVGALALKECLKTLEFLLLVKIPFGFNEFPVDILRRVHDQVAGVLNKCLKLCMKFGLDMDFVVEFLDSLARHFSGFREGSVLGSILSEKARSDGDHQGLTVLKCHMILEMIVSHSKFAELLGGSDCGSSINTPLLKFILYLVGISTCDTQNSDSCGVSVDCLEFLMQSCLLIYRGTVSIEDRMIKRVLHLAESACSEKMSPDHARKPIFSYPPRSLLGASRGSNVNEVTWVLQALTPPAVYATLANFPLQRSYVPFPIYFEHEVVTENYSKHMDQIRDSVLRSEAHNDTKVDDDNSEHGSDSDVGSVHDSNLSSSIDWLYQCDHKLLDPAYWLPCIHHCLHNSADVSMRSFANCGALALVVASLSSDCVIIRTYAKACLQLVLGFLQKQTPDKDSAFKERPQLLLVVTFIRNAMTSNDVDSQFPLPLTSGIFLARATLHLLQPQHTLFGFINKYLLSRPFCDTKDVPLYDLLIVDSDINDDAPGRLAALRLLRDCIGTKEDHLNMCRKNAYSRLMVYFMLSSSDIKVNHAILDIFDKSLSCPPAARYLLERCAFIPWLQQLSSVLNSNDISLLSKEGVSRKLVYDTSTNESYQQDAASSLPPLKAAPTRLLARTLALMRKTIGALTLLESDGLDIVAYLHRAFTSVSCIVQDIVSLSRHRSELCVESILPFDFFKQLTLCIWDLCVAISAADAEDVRAMGMQWSARDVVTLAISCRNIYQHSQHEVESKEVIISLLATLGFRRCIAIDLENAEVGECLELLMGLSLSQFFLPNITQKAATESSNLCMLPNLSALAQTKNHTESGNMYTTSIHLVHQELLHIRPDASCAKAATTPGSGVSVDECIRNIMHTNWTLFSEEQFQNTRLPMSLGHFFMLEVCVRAISSVLSCLPSFDSETASLGVSLSRWAIVMKKAFVDSFVFETDIQFSQNSNRIASRIVSLCDNGVVSDYSDMSRLHLLSAQLTNIATVSLIESGILIADTEQSLGSHIESVFKTSLAWLVCGRPNALVDEVKARLRLTEVWKLDQLRHSSEEFIHIFCGMLSTVLTVHDRDSSSRGSWFKMLCQTPLSAMVDDPTTDDDIVAALLFRRSNSLLSQAKCFVADDFNQTSLVRVYNDDIPSFSQIDSMWSGEHYETKSRRLLGSYVYHENVDFSTVCTSGQWKFDPKSCSDNSGVELLLKMIKSEGGLYTLRGESTTQSNAATSVVTTENDISTNRDCEISANMACSTSSRKRHSEIEEDEKGIVLKRRKVLPRFHDLRYVVHFSRLKVGSRKKLDLRERRCKDR